MNHHTPQALRKKTVKDLIFDYSILLILLLLCVVMSLLTSAFYSMSNLLNIVRQVTVVGLLAYGMTFVVISGGIDLSSGAVMAFAGVVVASLARMGMPVWVIFLAGVLLGALCGTSLGMIIAYTGIPAFIASLGLQQIARAFALLYSGGRPISDFKEDFLFIGNGRVLGILPVPVLLYIIIGVSSWVLLKKRKFGKHVYATGGNEQAAIVCGIRVKQVKIRIYALMGIITGIAAIVLTSRVSTGNPSVGSGYELDAITAVVIGGASLSGGTGTIFGTVIGALIIGVLDNGLSLRGVSPYWKQLIKGVLIISAVVLDMFKNRYARK